MYVVLKLVEIKCVSLHNTQSAIFECPGFLVSYCWSVVFIHFQQQHREKIPRYIFFYIIRLIGLKKFLSVYYLANKCPIFQCNECFTNVLQAPEWTEEDLSQLTRSMVKFPGGTPGRWEKIAHELGRSVADVSSLRFALCRG